MAMKLGADFVVDPNNKMSNKQLEELTNSKGFDICVEAVGFPTLLDYGISKLRPRGQALMIGVHPEKSHLPSDLYDFHYREIKLFGAFGRGDYFNETPERISNFGLDKLVSKIFSLDEINEALVGLYQKKCPPDRRISADGGENSVEFRRWAWIRNSGSVRLRGSHAAACEWFWF